MKMQNITGQVGARARCRTYCDDPRTWRPVAHLPKSTGSRTGPEEDDRAIDAMIRSGGPSGKMPCASPEECERMYRQNPDDFRKNMGEGPPTGEERRGRTNEFMGRPDESGSPTKPNPYQEGLLQPARDTGHMPPEYQGQYQQEYQRQSQEQYKEQYQQQMQQTQQQYQQQSQQPPPNVTPQEQQTYQQYP